jgi:uncharacterized protein YeaO (DUF488 family)
MTQRSPAISIKRAYDAPERGDGVRILVDRLWPRGLRKDAAHFDEWRKELAPSAELRKCYGHQPERFADFTKRYRAELRRKEAAAVVVETARLATRRRITLLTASRDLEHSDASVLAEHLRSIIERWNRGRGT